MKKLEDTEADYPRSWENEETVNIPLESHTPLQDQMIHSHKLSTVSEHTQEPEKKIWKLCEESQSSTSRSTNNTTKEDTTKKIIENPIQEVEGVILHLMGSDLELFPVSPTVDKIQEDCTEITEARRVYLNNDLQVKDTVGTTVFEGIIETD